MNWIVKIEENETLRFKVIFDPLTNMFTFIGQHKIKFVWIDFIIKTESITDPDAKSIGEILPNLYRELKEKVTYYDLLCERMENIKWVEITL